MSNVYNTSDEVILSVKQNEQYPNMFILNSRLFGKQLYVTSHIGKLFYWNNQGKLFQALTSQHYPSITISCTGPSLPKYAQYDWNGRREIFKRELKRII